MQQYPPPGQPPHGGPQYSQAPGGQYQTYQPYGAQQPAQRPGYPGQPGYPGPTPGGRYSAPQGGAKDPTKDPQQIFAILKESVIENRLQSFYPDNVLQQLAQQIVISDPVNKLCQKWNIILEIGFDLVKLALFDIWFLIDDSGSIQFSQLQGELKGVLQSAAFASSLFDQDGFSVRFLNSPLQGDNVRTEQQAAQLVDSVSFTGATPLVRSLREKILRPVLGDPFGPTGVPLKKPILVIIITDGSPTDGQNRAFQNLIKEYKVKPVSFQIAQVGTDQAAQAFLSELDTDPEVGHLIDCTSNFELEGEEFRRKTGGETLTREMWYTKLLLGSIDKSYDEKDETMPAPGRPAVAPQIPSYNQPPSGQYGAPTGYPPYQQPGYNPSAGYAPPPQGQPGYPPQQPGYGQYGQQLAPSYQSGGYGPSPGHSPAHTPQPPYAGYPPPSPLGQYGYGAPPPQQHGQHPPFGQPPQGQRPPQPQQYSGTPQPQQYSGTPQPQQYSGTTQGGVYTGQAPPTSYAPAHPKP